MGGRGRSGSAFRGYDFFSFHKATTHLSSTNIDSAKQASTEARDSIWVRREAHFEIRQATDE